MAIAQGMCSSFKAELMLGVHDIDTDVIKMALYTDAAALSAATTVYTSVGEVVGAGYVAGGKALTGGTVVQDGTVALGGFDDTTFNSVTLTARGALIYNSSKANRAIAVLDFGSDKTSVNGDFGVIMPSLTATTALLRIV